MLPDKVSNALASIRSATAIARYVLAVALVSASFLFHAILIRYAGLKLPPFILCYPAIMLVALLAGRGPGLLATILGSVGADYFFMPSVQGFAVTDPAKASALGLFFAMGVFMSLVAERYRRSQRLLAIHKEEEAIRAGKEELRKVAEYRQLALDAAKMGLWEIRKDSGETTRDDNCGKLFGIQPEETVDNDTLRERIHPADRSMVDGTVKLAMAGTAGALWGMEYRVVWPDGSIHWIATYGQAFTNGKRGIDRLVGVSMDITDRKQAEESLRKSEQEYRLLFEQIPDGIFITDAQGKFTDVNSAGVKLLGYAPDELINLSIPEILAAEEVERIPYILGRFATDGVADFEIRHKRKGGSIFEGSVTGRQLSDGRMVAIVRDVTKIKRTEEELRERERQFHTLADSIPQLCWMASSDNGIFWFNQRWFEYTGTSFEQMKGWGWLSLVDPEAQPAVRAQIKNAVESMSSVEMIFPLKGADGSYRSFLTRVVPIVDADGGVLRWFGTNTDIDQLKRVERKLRSTNAQLDLALEVAELGELDVDLVKHSASCSLRRDRIFGYETLQRTWNNEVFLSHVLPEDRADFEEKLKASSRSGIWNLETRIRRVDGKIRWISVHGRGESYEADQPTRMYGVIKDITQEKRAEEERERLLDSVRRERDTLLALIGAMKDEVWFIDAEKRVALVNPAALSVFGFNYAPNIHIEELGKGLEFRRIDGSLRPIEESPPLRALRGEVVRNEEEILRFPTTDELRHREVHAAPIRDAAGVITGSLVVVHDITRRNRAETQVRQLNRVYSVLSDINQTIVREENSQALLEAACRIAVDKGEFRMAWIGMIDSATQKVNCVASSGVEDGYLDRVRIDLLRPSPVAGPVDHCFRTGEHAICNDIEHELLRPWKNDALQNGYRSVAAFPLRCEGKIVGVFCLYATELAFFNEIEVRLFDELAVDISFALDVSRNEEDRKKKEEELRQLNRVHNILSDLNRTIIREKSSAMMLEAACSIAVDLGKFRMAWIGMIDPTTELVKPVASCGNADGYPENARITLRGAIFAEGPSGKCIRSGEHAVCNDIEHDLSFLPWRDEALKRGYRSMASLPLFIDGRVVGVLNLYAAEIGFFKGDELALLDQMAMDISFALEINRLEENRKKTDENLRWQTAFFKAQVDSAFDGTLVVDPTGKKILQNQRLNEMFKIPPALSNDRNDVPQLEYVAGLMKDPRQFTEKVHYLYSHPEEVSRDQLELADGSIFERYSYPVRDKALNHYGRIWSFRDITERRQLEEQFRQSQKMEAVGQLTGGIAHDFNNLLAVIIGNLDLLERQIKGNEAAVKRVHTARNASLRGAEVTRRLLAFARQQDLKPANLDLNSVVQTVLALAAPALGPTIQVITKMAPAIPKVFADASGLESALLNLFVNARDAMPKGGKLIVTSELRTLEAGQFLGKANELTPGCYAFVTVSDTGHGMTKEVSQKVFEPFFTTKSHGTGLGLAMVYGFFKQSGGTIRIYSEPQNGTTFSFYLPLADRVAALPSPVPLNETCSIDADVGTILIVDDDPDLREIASTCLSECGYTVLTANDGESATKVLKEHDEIVLLFTDIIMPGGVNGVELAHRGIKMRPGLRVIYCSGFQADALAERNMSPTDGPLLRKPYQRHELTAIVREVLRSTAILPGDEKSNVDATS